MARRGCCRWVALGVGAALALATGMAGAVPLSFSESTDFGNTNTSGPTIGPFDVGVNTVSGSVFREAPPPTGGLGGGDYGDFWEIDLAAGLQITAAEIVFSNVTAPLRAFLSDVVIGGFDVGSYQAFTQQSLAGTYELTTTPAGSFRTGAYPFPAGHYYFGVLVLGTSTGGGADYEWRVTVGQSASVPEPLTIALLGFGLAGIGLHRRARG